MRLSIDLSNRVGSLALHKLGASSPLLIGATSLAGDNRHAELLLTELEKFLKLHSVTSKSLAELVTSSGPGSFTGMRIAISTMKAFAMAWKLPLFLANASEVRARAFLKRNPEVLDLVVLTKVSSMNYSKAEFSIEGGFKENETIELKDLIIDKNTVVLVDTEETKKTLNVPGTLFPIQAEYFGEQLDFCASKTECRTFEDLVKASPHYYGSSRF